VPKATLTRLDVLAEGTWPFRGDGNPRWHDPASGLDLAAFDPFPAYPHDWLAAEQALTAVTARWTPPWDITVYLANREETSRTNGFSHVHAGGHYDEDGDWEDDPVTGVIVLGGKRVPPHPVMTAYLIAHEFGHHAEWAHNREVEGTGHPVASGTCRDYIQLRGLPATTEHHGGGGDWHSSVHEIFACDFRILVAGVEPGYWPHPGVPHPEKVPGLAEWWADTTAVHNEQDARSGVPERAPAPETR
jgi:hypothetical protein